MELKIQKRLAAQILKCSQHKIVFDNSKLKDIKEAITKVDIKTLIANNKHKSRMPKKQKIQRK